MATVCKCSALDGYAGLQVPPRRRDSILNGAPVQASRQSRPVQPSQFRPPELPSDVPSQRNILGLSRRDTARQPRLVLLFAAFGVSWLVFWIVVTTLRARVVEFFEKHDEDGALMQYHNLTEGFAHGAGFRIFTVVFPAAFALFWLL